MGNGNERPVRRAYRNPTEDLAIGNIMREERRKKRNEGRKSNEERKRTAGLKPRHRISVWRGGGCSRMLWR